MNHCVWVERVRPGSKDPGLLLLWSLNVLAMRYRPTNLLLYFQGVDTFKLNGR